MNPSEINLFPKYKAHLRILEICLARSGSELPRNSLDELKRNKKTAELVLWWSIFISHLRNFLETEKTESVKSWLYFTSFLSGAFLGLIPRLDLNGPSFYFIGISEVLLICATLILYFYELDRIQFKLNFSRLEKEIAHLGFRLHPESYSIKEYEKIILELFFGADPIRMISRSLEYASMIQLYGWESLHKVSFIKRIVLKTPEIPEVDKRFE
ncbi:hypothetical protein [Leptospira alexanderi]|uniref:hypothetical protein n=1 Tax=Leptospira alexanderi TaxID=100053 RepID=UPI0011155496|nr:hypothetical protein [Leptospira alexanderi]